MSAGARLASLEEVAQAVLGGDEFSFALRDFLDGFYANPTPAALSIEPACIPGQEGQDAYLGAVCEHFCRMHRWVVPAWARVPNRVLTEPVFFATTHKLRMLLLMDSPAAFRERNLFVSANALDRV